MPERYNFDYSQQNIYGHVVALLKRAPISRRNGIHLDLGCGFGPMAEQIVAATNLTYIGVDAAADGIAALASRGFEAHQLAFRNSELDFIELKKLLGDRELASVSCIDVLEHVPDPGELLKTIRLLAGETQVPLVTSVPNITHIDVAAKYLFGTFESTDTGILDRTHITHFTNASISELLRSTGWMQMDAFDVEWNRSDQYFPADHIALAPGSLLANYLHGLRQQADKFAITNQLVRLSLPVEPQPPAPRNERQQPFLGVIVPVRREAVGHLWQFMLCLLAQSDQGFTVLFLGVDLAAEDKLELLRIIDSQVSSLKDRLRFVDTQARDHVAALNCGLEDIFTQYVAAVPAAVILASDWVSTFRTMAADRSGAVLRAGYSPQQSARSLMGSKEGAASAVASPEHCSPTSLIEHLRCDLAPPSSYAWPSSLARDLRRRYDTKFPNFFAWDFFVRAAALCGLATSSNPTSVVPARDVNDVERQFESEQVRGGFGSLLMLLPASEILQGLTVAAAPPAPDTLDGVTTGQNNLDLSGVAPGALAAEPIEQPEAEQDTADTMETPPTEGEKSGEVQQDEPHREASASANTVVRQIIPANVHGGEKTIQWSACVCAGAGGVKVGHWIG